MEKYIIFVIFLIGSLNPLRGQDLNSYDYVIVPAQFDFLKEADQYQLNQLTKFLFEKHGFETFIEGNEPPVVQENRCKALRANLKENSGLLVTKLEVVLKDCYNKTIFVSAEGRSRKKDYKQAYHSALRDAFTSLAALKSNRETERPEATVTRPEVKDSVQGEIVKEVPVVVKEKERPNTRLETVKEEAAVKDLIFTRENTVYYLEETNNGFNFFQKGMAEPFASLSRSATAKEYLYNSITAGGIAYFNERGDLLVEINDPETSAASITRYVRQDQ